MRKDIVPRSPLIRIAAILIVLLVGCTETQPTTTESAPSDAAPTPTEPDSASQPAPTVSDPTPSGPTPSPTPTPVAALAEADGAPPPGAVGSAPDLVLYNAKVVTVDARFSMAEAVAVKDGAISAVGSSADLVAVVGPDTIVVDLEGRAVLPGFVETHTHLMQVVAPDTAAMMAGHDDLVRQGITTAGMPSVLPAQVEGFEKLDADELITLRAHLYLAYNSVCGEPLGDSYLAHPFSRDPDQRLAIAGVKIFADGGVCGGPALSVPYLDSVPEALYDAGWVDNGQLYVTDSEISSVLKEVDEAGGQTVIHAIGDLAIATALSGIDLAGPLTNPRQIHHNSWASLVDPALLRLYGEHELIPVVQMMPWARACEPGRAELWQSIVAPEALAVVEDRVAINAANPGIRWAWHGDGPSIIGSPLQQMFSIVTQGSTDGGVICYPPAWADFPTVSVAEAIRMVTINAAAAMGFETDFGSIEVGKAADLVVLQNDPFDADAEIGLAANRPLATIISGGVEFCAASMCRALRGREGLEPPPATTACVDLAAVVDREPIGNGLAGWWPAEGSAVDIVGTNDGTVTDGVSYDVGAVGETFALAGGTIALAEQPILGAGFTIEGWVLFDGQSFDDFQSIFNNGHVFLRKNNAAEGNGLAVFIELDDGTLEPRAQVTGSAPVGEWSHVAATWDGTTLAIYLDGQPRGASARAGNLTSSTVDAQIGRGESSGTEGPLMFGSIDEFAYFTRALTASEVRAIFDAGSLGKCRG